MDLLKTLENIMSNLSEEKHGNVGNLIDYFEELKIELMVKRVNYFFNFFILINNSLNNLGSS